MRSAATTLTLLTTLLLTTLATAAERWYVLEMQGQRAGWTVEREQTEAGRITSTTESNLTIKRGTTSIQLKMASTFIETESGEPIEMSAVTSLSGTPTTDRWIFNQENVRWISSAAGRSTEKTLPRPEGSWLPPAAAARYVAARLKAGAKSITVRAIDPLNGLDPVVTTRSGFTPETTEVLGRDIEAIRCSATVSLYPDSVSTEFIDQQGRLLRSEVALGAMIINVIAADEDLAKADLDPPELMASVFISPSKPIPNAYRKSRGSYLVTATTGTLPDIPATGSQHTTRVDERTIRVSRSTSPGAAEPNPPTHNPALTQPSAMINADDPRIIELTTAALRGAPNDPTKRAERLRRTVHRHIRSKDLSVGFASAAETARTREGDCTEHAVLLAAMLRADGTPARVISGLIYADRFAGGRDIFGYHMWAQALLPADPTDPASPLRWVDLDATLPDALPLTATHIALGAHTLEGDSRTNALVDLAPLMGRLAIEIESVE